MYAPVGDPHDCELLCSANSSSHNKVNESSTGCCDPIASCTCGTATGHYACMCPAGYFGNGLAGSCQRKFHRLYRYICVLSALSRRAIINPMISPTSLSIHTQQRFTTLESALIRYIYILDLIRDSSIAYNSSQIAFYCILLK